MTPTIFEVCILCIQSFKKVLQMTEAAGIILAVPLVDTSVPAMQNVIG